VAEDEDYLLDVLTQAMGEAGAVVTAAASGEEAWKAFGEDRFDCVWSDQRMPGCTGTELLRRIRATGSRVPFILASGQDLKPLRQSLGEDPHLRFMPKPFAIGDLIGEIQGLIAPPPNG
jgi:CheY-like chemotaxis protein